MFFANPLPVLPISAFVRAGVFQCASADGDATGGYGTSRISPAAGSAASMATRWHLALPGVGCDFAFCAAELILKLRYATKESRGECTVRVDRSKLGQRWFFRCDCCCQRRDRLIFDGDRLLCRETYVDRGQGGSRPIRRARVTLAMEDLGKLKPAATRHQPPETPVADAISKPPVAPRWAPPSDWQSTRRAILLGRGAGDHGIVWQASLDPPEQWRDLDPAGLYHRPDETALMGQVPELDLRVLAPSLLKRPGRLVARTLCWGERTEAHEEILFIADWRGDTPQLVAGHDFAADRVRWQALPLFCQANGRFRFVCPVERKNYDILYLRNGSFASRDAQRMVQPSQRAAGKRGRRHKG